MNWWMRKCDQEQVEWSSNKFKKAYDNVDWGFLDHVLERKGFGTR